MDTLALKNRERVLDLLAERLTFERAGVKLYDALIREVSVAADPWLVALLDEIEEHRDQEKEHEEWLESVIRGLGGDTEAKTERALLVEKEAKGIEEVMLGSGRRVDQMFHALLTAELADNAGWDLLVQIADEA